LSLHIYQVGSKQIIFEGHIVYYEIAHPTGGNIYSDIPQLNVIQGKGAWN
jgi:hypothetical protein